jgi:hypothetical protein
MVVAGTLGAGVAGAAPNAGAPQFNSQQASALIRGSGSDTTFFMMQKIGDLYTQAGLYGCQLSNAAGQSLFGGGSSVTTNLFQVCQTAEIATTDEVDNFNRVEVVQGVNDVGSGAGQRQLCSSENKPVGLAVDFARSSKTSSNIAGCNEQQLGYAKDGVPIVDFPTINPSTFGTSTFGSASLATVGLNGKAAYPNVAYNTINGGVVGPVANGWLPGDNPAGTSNKGTKVGSISNIGAIDTSIAFRMWCATSIQNPITDWGQLSNLGPNLEVTVDTVSGSPIAMVDAATGSATPASIANGQAVTDPFATLGVTPFGAGTTVSGAPGASTITMSGNATTTGTYTLTFATGLPKLAQGSGIPVGVPVRIVGVNTASGTTFTFARFAAGQTADAASACGSSAADPTKNAANDPNTATAGATNPTHIALENNAHQLELFSQADFPGSQVDQAIEEATSFYFMSNGVYQTNNYVGGTQIGSTQYAANLVGENSVFSGTNTELNNTYPTARTLFNIVNYATVRQSTGGFMNWICDAGSNFTKGTDLNTGTNYDTEVGNIISTNFGFPRLSDISGPVSTTPANNVSAPNDNCTATIPVISDGLGGIAVAAGGLIGVGGNFPIDLVNSGSVIGTGVPIGTTLSGGAGTNTLTLSNTLVAGNYTLEFVGVPAVVATSALP